MHSYQGGNTKAAEALCKGYASLVSKIAHRYSVCNSYGEDAENMLWVWFLEFLSAYKGNDFQRLPGLIKRFLAFKMLREQSKSCRRWSKETCTDYDASYFAEQEDSKDALQGMMTNVALEQELEQLPPQQREVIRRIYLYGESVQKIAQDLHCTERNIWHHKKRALKTLREKFY